MAASRDAAPYSSDGCEHTRSPVTKPKLLAFVGDDDERYQAEVLAQRKSAFDLLCELPACEWPFAAYLESLSPLSPRYHSIFCASTPVGICSVTVGVVQGPAASGEGVHKGVCSNYLATCLVGDVVHGSIRATKAGFHLPDDLAAPILMIGPGTGLAPFRGFLQQRAERKVERKSLGPATLFFGCRKPDEDFFYADELKGFEAAGLVELRLAFSTWSAPARATSSASAAKIAAASRR